jgi:hypothetical protein
MEVYVNQIVPSPSHSPTASSDTSESAEAKKYQYQRALDLSRNLRNSLFVYSNEHIKQMQDQSVVV